jgi:hypothetical protein
MIFLNFQITNPWSDYFKTGYVFSGNLFWNKFWELQAMRTHDIVALRVEATIRRDHAGFALELGLLSFNLAFTVYDSRHWDHEEERWNSR